MFCKSQVLILSFEILGVVRLNSSSSSLECEDFLDTSVQYKRAVNSRNG